MINSLQIDRTVSPVASPFPSVSFAKKKLKFIQMTTPLDLPFGHYQEQTKGGNPQDIHEITQRSSA